MTTTTFLARMLLFCAATSWNGSRHRFVNAFVGSSLLRHHTAKSTRPLPSMLPSGHQSSQFQRSALQRTPVPGNNWRLLSTVSGEIEEKIKIKGDEIRQLKADGIDKETLAPHIKELLALKAQLEDDNKSSLEELNKKIAEKGDQIRQLKADGVDKETLAPHIEELLSLKAKLPTDESAEKKPAQKKKGGKQKQKQNQNNNKKKADEPLSESEIKLNRLAKVDAMREANVEPFEYTYDVTTSASRLAADYSDKLEPGEEDEESDVGVAGRIMTRRVFGKLAFFSLQDETGIIQLQFDKKRLGDTFKVCNKKLNRNKFKVFVVKMCLFASIVAFSNEDNVLAFIFHFEILKIASRASKIGRTVETLLVYEVR